jgi:hypothetical protein
LQDKEDISACHEGRIDNLQSEEIPRSFIANGVVIQLGQPTDLLREVMFDGNIRGTGGVEVRESCGELWKGEGSEERDAFNATLLPIR